ncbi:hypothetical protein CDV36_015554 [Fusarium kuroshium]|uniref:Uncharacterized protein n=1 Tax=Fusarium kuroshium TaxID=2010991 RepID=A0A3M2R9H9_9HYPO|nr:hypothetical protein CDV36_015554 [Fusarium kuroshium]
MNVSRAITSPAFLPNISRAVAYITLGSPPPVSKAPPTVAVQAASFVDLAGAAALGAGNPDFPAAVAVWTSGHLCQEFGLVMSLALNVQLDIMPTFMHQPIRRRAGFLDRFNGTLSKVRVPDLNKPAPIRHKGNKKNQ